MTDLAAERPPAPQPTPQLNKALSQLQGKLPKITKGNTADIPGKEGKSGYKYSYADLADVTAAVGPLLAEFGLAFHAAPTINPADRREMILTWSLLHESGEERAGEWPLGPVSTPPQTLGSRITYGRRYCLGSATGIVAEEDDDGQRAQNGHNGRQSAGDLWDSAAPARPRQAAQDGDERPWAERALDQAGTFKTEAEGNTLWLETNERAKAGEITTRQKDHIQNKITQRIAAQRMKAARIIMRDLAEDDPWRDKVEELDPLDLDGARTVLEQLQDLSATGQLDTGRARVLGRAVIARFPKAAVRAAPDASPAATASPVAGRAAIPPTAPAAGEANLEDQPGTVSKAQLTKLHTVFTKLGFNGDSDRELKLGVAETVTGRKPLDGPHEGRSSKNLSWTEARRLIDTLDGLGSRGELDNYLADLEAGDG